MVCGWDLRLNYIELHAASAFSFLEGASLPEELIGACREYEMPAMALLDRDGVYGAARFHLAAQKASIQAHIGAAVSVQFEFRKSNFEISYPLLAADRTGYQNLCRLITRMKLNAPKGEGAVSEADLIPFTSGLICLTGGDRGPLTEAIRKGGPGEGRCMVERLVEIFGRDSVYVE